MQTAIIKKSKKPKTPSETPKNLSRRQTECLNLTTKQIYRTAFSEISMLDACEKFDFQEGHSYNFVTMGDVDSLTYLKAVLRQQNLEYLMLSTWCMAAADVFQIKQWVEAGKIRNLDCYVGEIFPTSYKIEFKMLIELYESGACGTGRLCVFKNHSKIYAGYGEKFHFGIQTSANINTNPRCEQGCITISQEHYEFYKNFFDKIQSFNYGKE